MTPIEKVRNAVNTLASMYAAWPTGPAVEGQPMPEGLNFGVSLKAVLEAREALSLLEGKALVDEGALDDAEGLTVRIYYAPGDHPDYDDVPLRRWIDQYIEATGEDA